jgi:hypothetical protein
LAARRKQKQSAPQMTPEERKQIRQWIEDEAELIKTQDTEHEPLSDQLVPLMRALLDRLIEKHGISDSEQYDDVQKLIYEWWIQTATEKQLRQHAAQTRKLAEKPSTADPSELLRKAELFDDMAEAIAENELARIVPDAF